MMFDPLAAILGGCAVFAIWLSWTATRSKNHKFDFEAMLLEGGKASLARVGQLVALVVSTWAMVYLTLHDSLGEWYFTTYMLAWAGVGVAHKMIDRVRPAEIIADPEVVRRPIVSGERMIEDEPER